MYTLGNLDYSKPNVAVAYFTLVALFKTFQENTHTK